MNKLKFSVIAICLLITMLLTSCSNSISTFTKKPKKPIHPQTYVVTSVPIDTTFVNTQKSTEITTTEPIITTTEPINSLYNIYINAVKNHEQTYCTIHNTIYNIDIEDFNIYQLENSDDYIVYLNEDGSCTAIIKSDNTVEFYCE